MWEHQKEGEFHAQAAADVPERPAISIPESNNAMGVHGTMPCGCVFSPCFLCTRTAASERAQRALDEQAQKQADAEDTRTLAGECAGLVEGSKAVLNTVCTATNELYRPGGGGFDEIKFEKAKAKDLFDAWKRQLGTLGVSGVADVPEAIKNLRDAKENGPVGGRIEVQHAELCDALDKVLDLVEKMHKSKSMSKKLFKPNLQTMKRHLNSLSDVLESVQARTVPSQTPAPALAKPPNGKEAEEEVGEAEEAPQLPGKRHYDFVEILLIELSGEGVHPDEISSLYTELHCTGLSTLKKLCEERPDCMDSVVAKLWGLATRIGVDPFSETWNKELAPYTTCDESSCTQRYEAMVGHDMKLNQTLDRLKAHMFLFTFMAWWHTRSAEGGSQADRKQQMSQRLQWILGTLYIRSDFYELRLKRTAIATVSMALSKPFHDKLSSMLGKDRSVADWAASHTRQWAPIILKAHFVTYFRPIFDHMETFGSLSSLNSAVSDAINKFDAEHGSALHDVMVVMAKMTEIQGACTNVDCMTPSDRASAKQTLVKMINAALKEVHNATFDKHDMTFQFYTVHCKPTFESVAKVITSKTGDATARYEAVYNPSKQKSADDFKIGDSAAFFKKTEFAFERFNCASSSHGNVSSSALLIYGAKKASGKAPVSSGARDMPLMGAWVVPRANAQTLSTNPSTTLVRVLLKQMKTDLLPKMDAEDPTLDRMSPTKRMRLSDSPDDAPDGLSELFKNTTPLEGGREYVHKVASIVRGLHDSRDMSKFEAVAKELLADTEDATLLAYMCVDIYSKPAMDGSQRPSISNLVKSREYPCFREHFTSLRKHLSQTIATSVVVPRPGSSGSSSSSRSSASFLLKPQARRVGMGGAGPSGSR